MSRYLWVLALVAACGGAARSVRTHKPGDEYLVAIKIEGAHALDPADLIPRLGLYRVVQREGQLDDYQLQLDVQRLATAFQKRGYFQVDVKSRLDKDKGKDAATIVFAITEGPQAKSHVELVGLPPEIPIAQALAKMHVTEGQPFDYDAFDAAKDPLLELAENAGYAHARVVGTVLADRAKAQATLRYTFDLGPPSKFGDITLVGATGVLADAIRVRIRFTPGERYSRDAVQATQDAIYGMGLFASARVEPDQESLRPDVAVKITVTPVNKNELSAGGGVGYDPTSFSIRGRLQYLRRGFLNPLLTSRLDFKPELAYSTAGCNGFSDCREPRGRVIETLTQQDFLLPDVRGDVEGGFDYLVYEAYAKLGAHVRLGITAPLGTRRLQLRLGWQNEYADFPSVFIDPVDARNLGIDKARLVGAYTGALVLDLRDHAINPTRGLYTEVRVAHGTKYALGELDYWQLTPEVRLFAPLGPFVLAARGRLGTITGEVPATERYFSGGLGMRGFGQRQLSPRAITNALCDPTMPASCNAALDARVIGGAGLFETSFEVRTPTLFSLIGIDFNSVLFLDGGDVTPEASQLDLSRLFWAAGLGLRGLTPIGPIGFDLGYRLNRLSPGDGWTKKLNVLFAIGEAF